MMNINEEIAHDLKQLHMPTIRHSYEKIGAGTKGIMELRAISVGTHKTRMRNTAGKPNCP